MSNKKAIQSAIEDQVAWEGDLKKTTDKYHVIGAWVAVIFDIVFGATDYINVREHFEVFFIFRLCVSALTGILLVLRKPLNLSSNFLIFVPFLLISIQNAFMWSLMDSAEFQKHTLAYIALFIGAGMLVLWRVYWSIIVVSISIVANVFFLSLNSDLPLEEILASGALLTGTVMIFSIILIQTRYNLTKKEIIARLSLKKSNRILNKQKKIIESKNKDITASIQYAKKIQMAILPSMKSIGESFPEAFVFFKPLDIVSGDFYWYRRIGSKSYIAAVDCTGHGVPGAFMSMIGNTVLNRLILEEESPSKILNRMREEVISTLDQRKGNSQSDGMDIALCVIDHDKMNLAFSGAFNPLILFRKEEMIELKADRMPIGSYFGIIDKDFTNHQMDIEAGDTIFLYSDGFQDQIGGPDEKKYSSRRFKNFLKSIAPLSAKEQKETLIKEISQWKGKEEQLDDMLVLGFKVS